MPSTSTKLGGLQQVAFWLTLPVLGGFWALYKLLLAPQRSSSGTDDEDNSSSSSRGNGHRRTRSMSFSSYQMLQGCFPEDTGSWDTIINSVFYFNTLPSDENVRAKLQEMLFYDRFRSAAVLLPNGSYKYVDISAEVDVESQVLQTIRVCSEQQLREVVDEICANSIEVTSHSLLWRIYRIHNDNSSGSKSKSNGNGKSAVLVRVHHALGDGLSLVAVLMKIFEDANGQPLKLNLPSSSNNNNSSNTSSSSNSSSGDRRRLPSLWSFSSLWLLLRCTAAVLIAPIGAFDSDLRFGPSKKKYLKFNQQRKTVYMPVLKLSFVKALKQCAGVTVNDVMLALTTGMLQRYCQLKGDPLFSSAAAQQQLRARVLLPVAFPRSQQQLQSADGALRNLWALVSAAIPLHESDAAARLRCCQRTTQQLKSEPSALIQLWIQNNVLSRLPIFLQKKTGHDFFSRHTMVFSNVPGPQELVKFAGEPMHSLQVIFPNLLPQALIVSYNGGLFFNLSVDPAVTDRHAELPLLFLDEARALAACYGLPNDDNSLLVQQ